MTLVFFFRFLQVLLSKPPHSEASETSSSSTPRLKPNEVHPLFRYKCTELLSLYRLIGNPLHFCTRLLHDCSIPYCYWPKFEEEEEVHPPINEANEGKVEEAHKDIPPEPSNRVSRRVLNWILDLSSRNRFVMVNLNCPVEWDQQVILLNFA